jgi:hypothetical protein
MINPTTQLCPICLDDGASAVLHTAPASTPGTPSIAHKFHYKCIKKCFDHQLQTAVRGARENHIQLSCATCRAHIIPNRDALLTARFDSETPIVARNNPYAHLSKPVLRFLEGAGTEDGAILTIAGINLTLRAFALVHLNYPPHLGYWQRNQCLSELAVSLDDSFNMALIALLLFVNFPKNEIELSVKLMVTTLMVIAASALNNFGYSFLDEVVPYDTDLRKKFMLYSVSAMITGCILGMIDIIAKTLCTELRRLDGEDLVIHTLDGEDLVIHTRSLLGRIEALLNHVSALEASGVEIDPEIFERYFTAAPPLLRN